MCALTHLCGEEGIRTLGTLTHTTVFETAPFDRSGTSPKRSAKKHYFLYTCNTKSAVTNAAIASTTGKTLGTTQRSLRLLPV